jgi:hypothetical protein
MAFESSLSMVFWLLPAKVKINRILKPQTNNQCGRF